MAGIRSLSTFSALPHRSPVHRRPAASSARRQPRCRGRSRTSRATLPLAAKIKVHELRNRRQAELKRQLEELKQELGQLRVAKVTGGAASISSRRCASRRLPSRATGSSPRGFALADTPIACGAPRSTVPRASSAHSRTTARCVYSKVVRKSIARVLTVIHQSHKVLLAPRSLLHAFWISCRPPPARARQRDRRGSGVARETGESGAARE